MTDDAIPKTLGQIGYEAYARSTGGKTFDGRDMPPWAALPPHVVAAWEAAGQDIAASEMGVPDDELG